MGATLVWTTVESFRLNAVVVEVNKALGRRGPLYSFRLFRHDRGRNSNYCRAPFEAGDAMEAIRRANEWVDQDRKKQA